MSRTNEDMQFSRRFCELSNSKQSDVKKLTITFPKYFKIRKQQTLEQNTIIFNSCLAINQKTPNSLFQTAKNCF